MDAFISFFVGIYNVLSVTFATTAIWVSEHVVIVGIIIWGVVLITALDYIKHGNDD